jgi:hypothetical protein
VRAIAVSQPDDLRVWPVLRDIKASHHHWAVGAGLFFWAGFFFGLNDRAAYGAE